LLKIAPSGCLISCAIEADSSPSTASREAWISSSLTSATRLWSVASISEPIIRTGIPSELRTTKPHSSTHA
jgi:hypothetical protein